MKDYQCALQEGNSSLLEELAIDAGYMDIINIHETRIMKAMPLQLLSPEQLENDAESDMLHRVYFFWRDWKRSHLHPCQSLFFSKNSLDYSLHESPRTDWNSKYENHFTRVKATPNGVAFVDCYTPKGKNMVLMTGQCKLIRDIDDNVLDSETVVVLNMAANRENYPPYSLASLIPGPTLDLLFTKVFGGGALYCATFMAASVFDLGDKSHYFAAVATVGAESIWHGLLYNTLGKGFYKNRGITVGKDAIEYLLKESEDGV